jgi:hypothetical protein
MPESSARLMIRLTIGLLLLTVLLQPLLPQIEVLVQQTSNAVERWLWENVYR